MSSPENFRYPAGVRSGLTSPLSSRNRILGMVTPGKSGRSWSRTSPMMSLTRPEVAAAEPGSLFMDPSRVLVAAEEDEPVLADLHLVGVLQDHRVDTVAVDVGAVEASRVGDREVVALTGEGRVPPGDGHVVEEDLAVGVTAGGGDVLVEQEAAAGARAALNHEQSRADRERVDRRGVDRVELAVGRDLRALAGDADGGRRVTDAHGGAGVARGLGSQLGAALRAELRVVGVRAAAVAAVRHR